MFENCTLKYLKDLNGNNFAVKIVYPIDLDENGNERTDKRHKGITAPMNEENTDYQNILEWVAEVDENEVSKGNTIEEAD